MKPPSFIVNFFNNLPKGHQENLIKLSQMVGRRLIDIDETYSTNNKRTNMLFTPSNKDKGAAGVWFETILTGNVRNNRAEADWVSSVELDVRFVGVRKSTNRTKHRFKNFSHLSPKEVLRITKLNLNQVRNTQYDDTTLKHKSLGLVGLYEYQQSVRDVGAAHCSFEGFAVYDINDIAKQDYEQLRSIVLSGQEHTLTSSRDDRFVGVQPYSNSQRPNGSKSLYLFKHAFSEELIPVDFNNIFWSIVNG